LERAYNNAKRILTAHDKELHALAKALLENETLTGAQIKKLLAQVNKSKTKQPESAKVSQEATTIVPASPQSAAAAKAKGVAGTAAGKAKGVAGS
jgi:ATP-dependent metalloprotease